MANSTSLDSTLGAGVNLASVISLQYVLSLALIISSLLWASWSHLFAKSRLRLVSDVYVVGGSKRSEIRATTARFRAESKDLILDGYRYTRGEEPFYVPSAQGPRLMIPIRYMEELKMAPIDKVDFIGVIHEMFEYDYTGVAHRSRMVPNALGTQLTPRLPSVMSEVQNEINIAMNEEFPPCDNWTQVDIIKCMARIITRATSRMMGGTAMSRNKEWNIAAFNYTFWAFNAAQKIKKIPIPLRRFLAPRLPEVRKYIPWCFSTAVRVGVPLLEQRECTGEEANDFLQFLKSTVKGAERENNFVSHRLLQTSFASIHTSVATIGALLYDLCEYPELISILREEYEGILDQEGNIPKGGFAKMVNMDSVMKESQRHNPVTLLTFERIIKEDVTLKDGFTIPARSFIGVPSYHIAMDPKNHSDPEKFDGLRFAKLRNDPAWAGKSQFVSSNTRSLFFGYGRHACPGRQFVEQEIKCFLVKFLSNFELKFKDSQIRVSNKPLESQYLLQHVPILLRRRKL